MGCSLYKYCSKGELQGYYLTDRTHRRKGHRKTKKVLKLANHIEPYMNLTSLNSEYSEDTNKVQCFNTLNKFSKRSKRKHIQVLSLSFIFGSLLGTDPLPGLIGIRSIVISSKKEVG